jgi:hypothetical protein
MPYHSDSYRELPALLPSQRYSFALAAAKVRAGAIVIVMRAETDWKISLGGELHSDYYTVKNVQTGSLHPETEERSGNLRSEVSSAVDRVLRSM